jgi:hypothetical protein
MQLRHNFEGMDASEESRAKELKTMEQARRFTKLEAERALRASQVFLARSEADVEILR